jgi:hypothetical protein
MSTALPRIPLEDLDCIRSERLKWYLRPTGDTPFIDHDASALDLSTFNREVVSKENVESGFWIVLVFQSSARKSGSVGCRCRRVCSRRTNKG